MATIVLTGTTNSDSIKSDDATYLTARSGGTLTLFGSGSAAVLRAGQRFTTPYDVYESFVEFDTSSLAGLTITSAVLSGMVYQIADTGHTFTVRVRLDNYGATVTTGDYIAGASLTGTLLAHVASSNLVAFSYSDFTDDAMVANLNRAGFTRMVICTDRVEAGTTPTGDEFADFDFFQGDGNDPLLTVTYTVAGGDVVDPMGTSGFFGA